MKWLRRLIYRRVVKGFEYRLSSLESLMETAMKHCNRLYEEIDKLKSESPLPNESLAKREEELASWQRIYGDAFSRHEEVETGLIFVLKDYDRR